MNFFDIIVFAFVGLLTVIGIWKGLVKQVITLAGVIAGYIVAMKFYEPVSKLLTSLNPGTAKVVSFIAIFVACIIAASFIAWIVGRIFNIAGLGFLNRIGGGLLGFLKGYVIVSVVVMLLIVVPLANNSLFKNSVTLQYILAVTKIIRNTAPQDFNAKYNEKLKR